MFQQRKILEQYLSLLTHYTLKSISIETGIQLCRVFRLLNGSPMKLQEYEIFVKLINHKIGLCKGLAEMAQECTEKLSTVDIQDLAKHMERKLKVWNLKNRSAPPLEMTTAN
jgi:hypothetical protein